ncbi:MAG TPA: hypothetical protein VF792_03945 [Ktedonobacterales bacterium]
MGNRITNHSHANVGDLKMNNVLSDYFFVALALSCSALATTSAQEVIAQWLAARDQDFFGLGGVGFDVGDLPWDALNFPSQRDFLLAATTDAMTGERWHDLLDLDARWQQFVLDALGQFRQLVEHLTQRDLPMQPGQTQSTGEVARFERCPLHSVFLHAAPRIPDASTLPRPWGYRCIVCNFV